MPISWNSPGATSGFTKVGRFCRMHTLIKYHERLLLQFKELNETREPIIAARLGRAAIYLEMVYDILNHPQLNPEHLYK